MNWDVGRVPIFFARSERLFGRAAVFFLLSSNNWTTAAYLI